MKCSTMDPWLNLKFWIHLEKEFGISCVFGVSKCWFSPWVEIIISKLVFFEISLIVTKWSLSLLKCFAMDPWLQLKFWKHPKIRICTLLCVFSVSKCHLSPRVGIVLSKLVFFEIYLIVTKLYISCLKCSTMDLSTFNFSRPWFVGVAVN